MFAPSYNPFFRIVKITILATAMTARNTTRFSPWNEGKTNVKQHELVGFNAGRPLFDMIPTRTNTLAVVDGLLSRFF